MSKCCGPKRVSSKKRAAKLNLHLEQGASFKIPIEYTIDGVPVDLTGARIISQFRRSQSSKDTVFSFDSANDDFVIHPQEGKIIFTILPEVTDSVKTFEGIWDLVLVWSNENIVRLIEGTFDISRKVTRYDISTFPEATYALSIDEKPILVDAKFIEITD